MTAGETLRKSFDDFWMKSGDLRILDPLRRAYGVLLILNVSLLGLDRHRFFGTDSWVPTEMRREIVDPDTFDLYSFFPGDPWVITLTLLVLALSGIGLILSFYPRILAALILFLLTSIHHANVMLFDSEDVVFRLFAFFLIFVPSWSKLKDSTDTTPTKTTPTTSASRFPSWPRRLFQLQVCLIYLAAGIQKSNGEEWLDGSAIYYALRLDDMTLFQLPEGMTEKMAWSRLLSWSTLTFELLFPFLVWIQRLRWPCLIFAAGFHLGTAYALNLHLFHPIMLVGLLAFVEFREWQRFTRAITHRVFRRGVATVEA